MSLLKFGLVIVKLIEENMDGVQMFVFIQISFGR